MSSYKRNCVYDQDEQERQSSNPGEIAENGSGDVGETVRGEKAKKMDTMIGVRALRRTIYIVSLDVIFIRL